MEKPDIKPGDKLEYNDTFYNTWEYKEWGNTIAFFNDQGGPLQKIYGFKKGLIVGNELRMRTTDNRIGRFAIVTIEYKTDPEDMFVGWAAHFGYLENGDKQNG